jgi:hypothetical protein
MTEEVDYTVTIPATSQQTITGYSTVVVTASDVEYTSEQPLPPTTIVIPTSVTTRVPPSIITTTTSRLPPVPGNATTTAPAPPVVTGAAAAVGKPAGAVVALVLGLAGGLALF